MTQPLPVCPLMQEPIAEYGWELTGWVTLQGREVHRHVVPCGDLRLHQLDPRCWCSPTEADSAPGLWAHNSADGREAYEDAALGLAHGLLGDLRRPH